MKKWQTVGWRGSILMFATGIVLVLSGCGGGGGGGAVMPGATGVISGTAIKGPVQGAKVTAFGINANGTLGPAIGSAMTDSTGGFRMSVGPHDGAVMLQMKGGNYMDEASGSMMSMYSTDIMTSVIPAFASGETMTGVQVTPLTSMAQVLAAHMAGGMTGTNITAANDSVGGYFLVTDILHIMPMDPTAVNSGAAATKDEKDYGMAIAAMTQVAKSLGMPHSSGMVTAFMEDATDGVMDGMMGTTAISMSGMGGMGTGMGGGMMMSSMSTTAGTTGLASAMSSFMTNSAVNRSGLDVTDPDIQALMTKLNSAPTQTL